MERYNRLECAIAAVKGHRLAASWYPFVPINAIQNANSHLDFYDIIDLVTDGERHSMWKYNERAKDIFLAPEFRKGTIEWQAAEEEIAARQALVY